MITLIWKVIRHIVFEIRIWNEVYVSEYTRQHYILNDKRVE